MAIPSQYWPYFKGTQIQRVDLNHNQIGDVRAEKLRQCLQGTQVHTVDLSGNKIGDIGAEKLRQNLQGIQVYTVNLARNKIKKLRLALKDIKVKLIL